MTKQEAIEAIERFRSLAHGHAVLAEALNMAIEALSETKRDLNEDDLISRSDAIRLAEQGQIQGFPWQFEQLVKLPSAQPERWIPVSERLPEQDGNYLVTFQLLWLRPIEVCMFSNGQWDKGGYEKVLAWQPLPELYKGDADD